MKTSQISTVSSGLPILFTTLQDILLITEYLPLYNYYMMWKFIELISFSLSKSNQCSSIWLNHPNPTQTTPMSSSSKYVASFVLHHYANKLLNSQPIFNGPFKRAELLLYPQYAASNNFLTAGKWAGEKNYVLSVNNKDENTTEPLLCIVVGVISAEKAYLAKHRNFNSTYNEDASKAKIQFSIICPVILILARISITPLSLLKNTNARLPKLPAIATSYCRKNALQCI